MASDLALHSNESSMLLRSLMPGARDLSYSMPQTFPITNGGSIQELRPKQGSTITSPNSQEIIWDLNRYQYLRDLMIRTRVTKTAGHDNPVDKFYGLTMYETITLRSNNKVLQTLSDSYIRARVDNLPVEQKLAILKRALMLVPTTNVVATVDATSGETYTPIFSQFFDHPKNHLNLSFMEQLQVAARFNAAGTNGSNVVYDTATPTLIAWSYLPDLKYSNFLMAKNHKEGSILNMLTYNSQKDIFALDSTTAVEAKLRTNYPVFNIHYAVVNKEAIADAKDNTAIYPVQTVDLKFGGMSVFGTLPSLIVNYQKDKVASSLQLTTDTTVARVENVAAGTASYTGFSTIPFGANSVADRLSNSGLVSFNEINTPTLALTFAAVSATGDYELHCLYEYWNIVSIDQMGVATISASY